MRTLVVSVLVSAGLVAGCDLLPNANDPAPVLTTTFDAGGATFTLDPWQFDQATAFLCLGQPGEEFTASHPLPADAAQCQRLETMADGDAFTARFAFDRVPPALHDAFLASRPPWYLAVTGQRGAASEALVMSIENSPIPSDPGPS